MSVLGYTRLMGYLGNRDAKLISVHTQANGDIFAHYTANGRSFMVQIFEGDAKAFEIFVPVSASLSTDTVLAKLDEYIQGTI